MDDEKRQAAEDRLKELARKQRERDNVIHPTRGNNTGTPEVSDNGQHG